MITISDVMTKSVISVDATLTVNETAKMMEDAKVAQIRIVEATGAEKFAEFLFVKLNEFVKTETNNRVKIAQVEFMENNKNTAIYNE